MMVLRRQPRPRPKQPARGGGASKRQHASPTNEHSATKAVIESAECPSYSIATSPLTTAPVIVCMKPVAAPAAPAIPGKGCMAACIAFGATSPKAKLESTTSEMTEAKSSRRPLNNGWRPSADFARYSISANSSGLTQIPLWAIGLGLRLADQRREALA